MPTTDLPPLNLDSQIQNIESLKKYMSKSGEDFADLIADFLEGSAINEIKFDAYSGKFTIVYNYDVRNDEFDSVEELVEFLKSDQDAN